MCSNGGGQYLVSLIVPVYQAEKHLEECLSSIVAQDYSYLDVVLINDGSTDKSEAICERFVSQDSRFRVINQENGGLSTARNTGLDVALGEYIAFLDSDDVISPSHISGLLAMFDACGCDIATTNLSPFSGKFAYGGWGGETRLLTCEQALKEIFYQRSFDTCAPAKLYRSSLWDGVRFPVGYIHEDLPTVYKPFLRAEKIAFRNSETYGYRHNNSGLNHSRTTDKKVATLALVDGVVEEIDQCAPALSRAARCFRCSFCFHLLLNVEADSLSVASNLLLERRIKEDRFGVVIDCNARKKTRIACLLSCFGFGAVRAAFALGRRS